MIKTYDTRFGTQILIFDDGHYERACFYSKYGDFSHSDCFGKKWFKNKEDWFNSLSKFIKVDVIFNIDEIENCKISKYPS